MRCTPHSRRRASRKSATRSAIAGVLSLDAAFDCFGFRHSSDGRCETDRPCVYPLVVATRSAPARFRVRPPRRRLRWLLVLAVPVVALGALAIAVLFRSGATLGSDASALAR